MWSYGGDCGLRVWRQCFDIAAGVVTDRLSYVQMCNSSNGGSGDDKMLTRCRDSSVSGLKKRRRHRRVFVHLSGLKTSKNLTMQMFCGEQLWTWNII